MQKHGITYSTPEVELLHASPLWVAEVAARTAYNSFDKSEHVGIKLFPIDTGRYFQHNPDINSSKILLSLAWVHHHHSVIELVDISFSIKGTSRGVLQEHARHRIQSLTVQSTRYTMSSVLNAYAAFSTQWGAVSAATAKDAFFKAVNTLDMFVITDEKYLKMETDTIYDKLTYQIDIGEMDYDSMLSKEGMEILRAKPPGLFKALEGAKKKRNVGDAFKHIVTDNWKVDMVVKFNLRSLKNYLALRASGAAFWQINMLAEEMIKVVPNKYLELIRK